MINFTRIRKPNRNIPIPIKCRVVEWQLICYWVRTHRVATADADGICKPDKQKSIDVEYIIEQKSDRLHNPSVQTSSSVPAASRDIFRSRGGENYNVLYPVWYQVDTCLDARCVRTCRNARWDPNQLALRTTVLNLMTRSIKTSNV